MAGLSLTGILSQSEFRAKAAWQTATMFGANKHVGCKNAANENPAEATLESLASRRSVENLAEHEVIAGADVAASLGLKPGGEVQLFDEAFQVLAVLAPTGTVDDGRIFAHLHTVQRLANTGEVVSAIEVIGCCEDAAGQLVHQLAELLPDSRVVTIAQIVQTQLGVNRLFTALRCWYWPF